MHEFPTTTIIVFMYIIVFIYGVLIGSHLNVLINRIPRKENVVKVPSHCEECGYRLKWYDLVPLFSYIFLGGKCRKCKKHISAQHPIVEALNGILFVLIFWKYELTITFLVLGLMTSALVALSVIDFRTYEIPVGFNIFIGCLGIVRLVSDLANWKEYVIGFFAVSVLLAILYYASKGKAIGGGDVKLMAAAGLVIGWKLIVLSFLLGCIIGSVIHLIRMKVSKQSHVLAMGPYLSVGIYLSIIFGDVLIQFYTSNFLNF